MDSAPAHRRRANNVFALVLGVSALFAACATPGASPTPSGQSTPAPVDPEAVRVGAALEQIRGHHLASLELYGAGERQAAQAHAFHPVTEIIDSIRSDLTAAGADTSGLEAALEAVTTASQGDSEEALSAAVDAAHEVVQGAADAIAGATPSDAYVGSVISSLLASAAHEYSEAVMDGAIVELIEYQDAYAFIRRAHEQYGTIAAAVEAADAHEAEEIQEAFDALIVALPSVQPPSTLAPIEDIAAATALIGHELEEVVGALPVVEADPLAEQAIIDGLLDDLLELVAADQRDAAGELAAEIYLEHYEVIEAGIIAAAPDINAELEPLLGAGLRQQIRDGESLETITASVERAKTLLAQAVEALELH